MAALAGTARSTGVLGIAAANAISEASVYGLRPIRGALDFLYRSDHQLREGLELRSIIRSELKRYRMVFGYGRPLVETDERIQPLLRFAERLGQHKGHYVRLALEIDDYFRQSKYRYRLNIAGLSAAIAADQNLGCDEFYLLASLAFVAGIFPCYLDAKTKPEGSFLPLRVQRVDYGGAPKRSWGEHER